MKHLLQIIFILLNIVFQFVRLNAQSNESEPNNGFATADFLAKDSIIIGNSNNPSDASDYFMSIVPKNGTVNLVITATNVGSNAGYLYLYAYDRRKASGNILSKYVSGNSNIAVSASIRDTIVFYGIAADTFYFRLDAVNNFNYNIKYFLTDTFSNDNEPNGTFSTAVPFSENQVMNGMCGYYSNGGKELEDFYRMKLPSDGTIKIMVEATNRSGATNYFYLSGYDGRKAGGNLFNKYLAGNSNLPHNVKFYDTIYIYGRSVDSFFLKLAPSAAFTYSFKVEMIDTSYNDSEPNNNFAEAILAEELKTYTGHSGYSSNGINDQSDYYKLPLKTNGTLKLMIQSTNMSGSNNYQYIYGYDGRKSTGQILGKYHANTSNHPPAKTLFDTIYLYGRAIDTFYLRFAPSAAFTYSFNYIMTDTVFMDKEDNNSFEKANSYQFGQEVRGNARYNSNGGSDLDDYFSMKIPYNGTLKIIIEAKNNSGSANHLYFYGYDGRKGNGIILGKYLANNSNQPFNATFYDTVYLYGRAIDSFYLRIAPSAAFSYKFRLEMTDSITMDAEPNNTFATATEFSINQTIKGNARYNFNGQSDADDYYKTKLPYDGTIKLMIEGTNLSGNNNHLYFYGYDGRKGNGTILARYLANNSNQPHNKTFYDTVYLFGRAVDSFYIRIAPGAAFSYKFRYEIIDTSTNDLEPNDNFSTAIETQENQLMKGHSRYNYAGNTDLDDYYVFRLKKNGTLKLMVKGTNMSGSNNYLYMYGYDGRKGNGTILARYLANNSNQAHKTTFFDTFYLYGRATDSFYFRIAPGAAYSYEFSYQMIDTAITDKEQNNSIANSTSIELNKNTLGIIGYSSSGNTDQDDYYKLVIPSKGSVRIACQIANTGGGPGYTYLYAYDQRKLSGTIMAKYIANNSSIAKGAVLKDTIFLNCFNIDTLYLRWTSSGSFRYQFDVSNIDRTPVASTEHERLGNTVGFRPVLSNANSFLWDFGDGTQSTSKFPLKTFPVGGYPVRLIATNTVCNFKDTSITIIKVSGLEYYSPNKGGSGGDISMQIYGGGLSSNTSVKLVKGNITLLPVDKFTNTLQNRLTAVFDLHFAEQGLYDVIIQLPGDTATTFKNGFLVEKIAYPYTYSEIQGPSRMRNNQDVTFNLVVGNKGNVAASGVVLAMVWPKGITISFKDKFIEPPKTGIDTVIIPGDPQIYTLPYADYRFIYDSLNTTTPIDSFEGKPYNGYIRYLLIPHVPANSTIEFPFLARSTGSQLSSFYTFTHKPNLWGSCPTGNWTDYNDDLTAELIDGADMIVDKSNVPLLKAFTKTAKIGQKHGASAASYLGKHFWAWYDGYELDENAAMGDWLRETEANNAFALQTATDELGGLMLNKGIGKLNKTYQDQVDFINKTLANNKTMSPKLAEAYINRLNKLAGANKRLNKLKEIFDQTKNLGTLSDKLLKIQELTADCPELQKQLEDLLKNADKELDHQDVKDSPIQTANSFDPNEINGPIGTGIDRHISKDLTHRYRISFENVDSATAAAQIVYISDTLDMNKFDLSTFEFGDFTIGNRTWRVPKARQQFVMEIELDATMKVRINGELNLNNGVISWQFTAIDPLTGDLPIFEGFLPPNVNKPEGEGSVAYTVQTRKNLPHGTLLVNRANIIFDDNKPIITNTWTNLIDTTAPTSICIAKRKDNSSNIIVTFNGNDAGSGINYYNLYIKIDGGEWIPFGGSGNDTLELLADFTHTYSFCAIAKDNVGNIEWKSLKEESTLGNNSFNLGNKTLYIYPNPTEGIVSIKGSLPDNCTYTIFDINGKLLQSNRYENNSISLEGLENGFYIIRFSDGIQTVSFKVMKL